MYWMSTQALSPSAPARAPRRAGSVLLGAVLVAAVAAVAIALGTGGGDSRAGARELRGPGFTLAYPAGWAPAGAAQLARTPGRPAAVVRRADGKGIVIVRAKAAPRDGSLRALTADLTKRLGKRFPDFRFVSSRVVRVRGGNAFLYTFLRTRERTAQSIALVKVGATSYTLDAVAAAGDQRAARETAAIVRSFGR